MLKKLSFIFLIVILLFGSETVFSQKKSPSKKAVGTRQKTTVKTAKKTAPGNDDAALQLKLQETLKESENWKEYSYAKDKFKISFPRRPVVRQEYFDDEFLGRVPLSLYLSMGDAALFTMAHFRLPYAISDDAVLRKFYQDVATGFLKDDDIETTAVRDVQINGRLGLEIDGASRKNASEITKMRIFLVGKQVFYNVVSPLLPEDLSAQELSETQAKIEKETKGFFGSFAEITTPVGSIVQTVPALFKSTFVGNIYQSEYFGFTIEIPQNWKQVAQDDVSGMRESGRSLVKQNSKINVAELPNTRKNLFTFSAKPLGSEKNLLFACNLQKRPSPTATVLELSNLTEQTLAQVNFYTITKKTHKLKLGNTEFVGFELRGNLGGEEFRQSVYYCLRKDYALGFVMTYFSEEDKKVLFDSLGSLNFDAR